MQMCIFFTSAPQLTRGYLDSCSQSDDWQTKKYVRNSSAKHARTLPLFALEMMGVRTYTTSMQLTSTLPSALTQTAKVIIDWSNVAANVDTSYADQDIDTLINWVKAHPRRSNIHVYLRTSPQSQTRMLQRSLQTLGCTVIGRTTLSSKTLPRLANFVPREWR